MFKIDTHQHFWNYTPEGASWITPEMGILKNDILPAHVAPIMHHYGLQSCIAVQSRHTEEENAFLLAGAAQHPFIRGVVGWVDLCSRNVWRRLAYYARFPKLKGFRHLLQDEPDKKMILRPDFQKGIAKLKRYGFTYDIQVGEYQLMDVAKLAVAHPEQPFVLDHMGNPNIKSKKILEWKRRISRVAQCPNVYCKVSRLATATDREADIRPYLDVVFEAFGPHRLMFGSDWPVCRLSNTFGEILEMMEKYTACLSQADRDAFWYGTAEKFYHL